MMMNDKEFVGNLVPGALVELTPFLYENNPMVNETKRFGIFLGWAGGSSAWRGQKARVITNHGYEECWSSQWAVELAPNF
mgnify:CR=1 FL=1